MKSSLVLLLAVTLLGCDSSAHKNSGVQTVALPAFESFDRVVVLGKEITSAARVDRLKNFLIFYESGWFVPTFGSGYDNGIRVELYTGPTLVDVLFVENKYFARRVDDVHIRRINEEEITELEKVLGVRLPTASDHFLFGGFH